MNGEHSREAVAEIISLNVRYIKYLALREICNVFWLTKSPYSLSVEDLTDQFMGGEIDIGKLRSEIDQFMRKAWEKAEVSEESLKRSNLQIKRLNSLFRILERQDL